ncbi:hypothetical protein PAMP_014715 [Pampus punctatissimus]
MDFHRQHSHDNRDDTASRLHDEAVNAAGLVSLLCPFMDDPSTGNAVGDPSTACQSFLECYVTPEKTERRVVVRQHRENSGNSSRQSCPVIVMLTVAIVRFITFKCVYKT